MAKLDPRLRFLQQQAGPALSELEGTGRFAVEVADRAAPRVRVLLRFTGDLAPVQAAGFEPTTVAGDVAAGFVDLAALDQLAALDNVTIIESSRPMRKELDVSLPETRANLVHTGPPGHRGTGVIVGIIDSGIDFRHDGFRKPDGTSRILFIWDQSLTPAAGESNPPGFTFGVEYNKTQIDAILAGTPGAQPIRHQDRDPDGHGTHVCGIAAGDGSVAGNGRPAFTFIGVAPEADIIMVANAVTTEAIGDSAQTLDAVSYIFNKAASLSKPVVINMSQGDNLGPHDGTSLLERGIDNLLGGQGRAMVKSAGNAGADDIHASGTVTSSGPFLLPMSVPNGDASPDTVDLWYPGADRFEITLTPPGGAPSSAVAPGASVTLNLPNGNRAFVDSTLTDPFNSDNRIFIQLERGTAAEIQVGTWTLTLAATTLANGRFHAWIERGLVIPRFIGPALNNQVTISIPGTSKEIIAVASYITTGSGVGSLSSFSSRGPTRDARPKPEIAAPGEFITSALAGGSGTDQYHALRGTSMSSPHVAGAVALMLQKDRTLTQAQIKNCLTSTARSDAFTGATPNNDWGGGKLDVQAAFNCVAAPTLKALDDPIITLKFRDDRPTLKVFDDPFPTLKFRDDQPTIKAVDDPIPTLKFRDDQPTRKAIDDPNPTLKFRDDQPTIKAVDDPFPTLKFRDDGPDPKPILDPGPKPIFDPGPKPGLDPGPKPGLDPGPFVPPRPGGPGETAPAAAPFVLATPHHSMAWAQTHPQILQGMVADYEQQIAQYEAALVELDAAYQEGRLGEAEQQQYGALYNEYQALVAEYQQLIQPGQ